MKRERRMERPDRRERSGDTPKFKRSFSNQGSRGRFRSSGFSKREGPMEKPFRRERRDAQTMHKVICDNCKKECSVPFLPTEGKPVYCSDCFRRGGNSKGGISKSETERLEKKLDLIIKGLGL